MKVIQERTRPCPRRKVLFCMLMMFSSVCFAADQEVQQIQQMMNEQAEAWNRGDLENFIRAYDDTGRLVFIGSSGVIGSPHELKEKYEKNMVKGKVNSANSVFQK